MFNWYWPTSDSQFKESQSKLFKNYKANFHFKLVPVSLLDVDGINNNTRNNNNNNNNNNSCENRQKHYSNNELESKTKGHGNNEFINTITVEPFISTESNTDFRKMEQHEQDDNDINVVIGHGYGCGLGHFFKNLENISLNTGVRVHAIDWLGNGGSSRPPSMPKEGTEEAAELSEKMYIETLEQWRVQQNIKKMILVVHSLGGYLGAAYSIKYPEHVEKLILVSPVGIPENPNLKNKVGENYNNRYNHLPIRQKILYGLIRYGWENNITAQSLIRGLGPAGPSFASGFVKRRMGTLNSEESKMLSDYLYHISVGKPAGEYAQNTILSVGAYARRPLINRIQNLKVETVFVYGESDWMDPKGGQEAMKKMKGIKTNIEIVENAGHNIFIDNPTGFNNLVIKEIEKTKSKKV